MQAFSEKYGPWALVTGASSGLGAAFANRLAAHGLNLVLVARREDRLRSLARDLQRQFPIEIRVVGVDLSRDDFMSVLAAATKGLEVNLLINNAGHALAANFLDNELESELDVLYLNVRASLMLTHYYGKLMRNRRRGGIILLASLVALTGIPGWSNYAAGKGYALLFAEGLAEELKGNNVDVLALAPAFIQTEFMKLTAFGRFLSLPADRVAQAALTALGRKRTLTPGFSHKLIAVATRFQPRVLNTRIFHAVISMARAE